VADWRGRRHRRGDVPPKSAGVPADPPPSGISRGRLFSDPPLLHTWDHGETWNTGGFSGPDLIWLADLCGTYPAARVVETGAGCSTLAFLSTSPESVVTIAPDSDLAERITAAGSDYAIDLTAWHFLDDRSESALPRLVDAGTRADIALIDGGHGWPTPFVDFCYLNMMMRTGAILILDDLQLYSVGELARLLVRQWGWERESDAPSQKTVALRKISDETFLPDWGGQPYIVERSAGQKTGYEHYGLNP
jgi:hypothetical protein